MAGQIRIDTEQVAQIAAEIERLNKQLYDELEASKVTIKSLDSTWDGEAAENTIASYEQFANKFFQNYYDVINKYVVFLKENVSQGYFQKETDNINLADAFK